MQEGVLEVLQLLDLSGALAVWSLTLELLDLLAHFLDQGVVALSLFGDRGVY